MNITEISSHVDNKWELEVFFFSEHRGESQFHSGPEIFVINWSISHHHCSHCHHLLHQLVVGQFHSGPGIIRTIIIVIMLVINLLYSVNFTWRALK